MIIKSLSTPVTALKPEKILGSLVSDKYELVDYWNDIFTSHTFKYSVFNNSSSNIIHLLFPLSVKRETGTIGVLKDWREYLPDLKPEKNRGVILSYLLKGEPPDSPHITTPKTYQGKTLNSQRRMKANLLPLGADYIVSRSKPFQEGEYDEDIKSSSEKKKGTRSKSLENMNLRRAKGANQDICAINTPYLTNQEKFIHETSFVVFYT